LTAWDCFVPKGDAIAKNAPRNDKHNTQLINGAPTVGLAIINPASGPGKKADGNYLNTVRLHVGALPPECALLTQLSSGIEEMAVQASIAGGPTMVYRAICHDPLTAAVLSLAEIREMTNELFAVHKEYLPQFKVHKV
jgi:hypothetical protein